MRAEGETRRTNPYESPRLDAGADSETTALSAPVSLQIPAMALLVFCAMQILWVIVPLPVLLGTMWWLGAAPGDDLLIVAMNWVGAASCVVILIAALSMRRLRGYRIARVGAILACIPILSPVVYLGIPFGIWAIIVLRKPSVRALFSD